MTACTSPASPSRDVTVENEETNPLFSLIFNQVGDDTSTENLLLPDHNLATGAELSLPLPCGSYDIMVEVATGDLPAGAGQCAIADQDVCASGTTFVISDSNCPLDL